LRRLTVFQSVFRHEAAEQVAGASSVLLSALIAKPLLPRAEAGRYDLHKLIRQFATPQLHDDPQCPETYDRHCEFYVALVGDLVKALKSAARSDTVRELTGEMDNVRAAWSWAIGRGKFALVGPAVRALGSFFEAAACCTRALSSARCLCRR
jgi:hypothetical protein